MCEKLQASKTVAVNERGLRIGEDHPNAKLTDAEVETIRTLHAEGMSYRLIAEKFEVAKGAIAKICRYERRCQYAVDFKTVPVLETD